MNWPQALSVHNIVAGFHKCGVHPFNRSAIEILDDDTANESGIDLNCSNDDGTPVSEDFHPANVNATQSSHQRNEQSVPTQSFTSKIFCYFSEDLKRVMTSTTCYIRSGLSWNIQK